MKALASLLQDVGCQKVRTYIQSGNVAIQTSKRVSNLSKRISAEIKKHHGFEPCSVLFPSQELEEKIAANPFPDGESDPKALHFGFLNLVPSKPDLAN